MRNVRYSQLRCCTVNEHVVMVNMAASTRNAKTNTDNAISSEQITIKNSSIVLAKDDIENKNISTDKQMLGKIVSNNCFFKLTGQSKITVPSKLKAMRIKKIPM